MIKLIISIIILIISISTSYCNEIDKGSADFLPYYITFTPYDSGCNKQIPGIGFGSYNGGCVYNYSVETIGNRNCLMFTDDTMETVNLTSLAYSYDETIVNYQQNFKVNECQFNEFSNTYYQVSISKTTDNIPKGQWVIETLDMFCENVGSYWFVTPGISIPDTTENQTNTYACKKNIGYTTTCNGVVPGHTDNCLKLENPPGCSYLSSDAYQIYCSN